MSFGYGGPFRQGYPDSTDYSDSDSEVTQEQIEAARKACEQREKITKLICNLAMGDNAIAQQVGCEMSLVEYVRSDVKKREDEKKVMGILKDKATRKLSDSEIAQQVGCEINAVSVIRERLKQDSFLSILFGAIGFFFGCPEVFILFTMPILLLLVYILVLLHVLPHWIIQYP